MTERDTDAMNVHVCCLKRRANSYRTDLPIRTNNVQYVVNHYPASNTTFWGKVVIDDKSYVEMYGAKREDVLRKLEDFILRHYQIDMEFTVDDIMPLSDPEGKLTTNPDIKLAKRIFPESFQEEEGVRVNRITSKATKAF